MRSEQGERRPRLRFPEFEGLGGWEETELKEVLTEHKLKSDGKSEVHSVSVHRGVINQKEHLGRSFAAADTSNYNLAKPYDVIYTKSPTGDFPFGVVKHNHLKFDVIVSPLYGVFSPETPWLGYIIDAHFESPIRTKNYLEALTQKGAKNTIQITNQTFISGSLCLPRNVDEQTRIADCLSSLDSLIAAQTQKLDTLRSHKRGLMQQLFPAEGESVPRLRFPEFEGAAEWEERKLGSFIEERVQVADKLVKLFSLTIENGVTAKTERYERSFLVGNEDSAYKLVLPNDFAFNPMNLRFGAIAKHYGDIPVALSKYYNIFSCDETVNSSFCDIYFRSENMVSYYDKMAIGSLIEKRRVHFSDFLKFRIPLPTLIEQNHIADCLSSLDSLIACQTGKIAELKTFKRGLMQQLFPAPEGMEE
jgi:type I restriction enzyme, S subunit